MYVRPTPLEQDGLPLRNCLLSPRHRHRCRGESNGYESNSTIFTATLSANLEGEQEQLVLFGTIDVRKYEHVLGDHPCISSRTPVTLG
eukprot:4031349-Ditylum_brightwellii.AAC.1